MPDALSYSACPAQYISYKCMIVPAHVSTGEWFGRFLRALWLPRDQSHRLYAGRAAIFIAIDTVSCETRSRTIVDK